MRKKNLLIDEYPLLVLPSLAKLIGLNEAIALQQLHYWVNNPKGGVWMDGERWVYNTYEFWQKDNFPFWSLRTVQRVFLSLEAKELVVSMQKAEYDRKKYYRPHYANLALWNATDWLNEEFQDGTMEGANLASSLTETTRETNSDTNIIVSSSEITELEQESLELKERVKTMMEKAHAKRKSKQLTEAQP
jgi:hypothetical protein